MLWSFTPKKITWTPVPEKKMFPIGISLFRGPFSGAMLVLGGVSFDMLRKKMFNLFFPRCFTNQNFMYINFAKLSNIFNKNMKSWPMRHHFVGRLLVVHLFFLAT